jgi:hypothetical protein
MHNKPINADALPMAEQSTREVHIFDCCNCMPPNTKVYQKTKNKILLKRKKKS